MVKCFTCTRESSSDNCNKMLECGVQDNVCFSDWRLESGKPLVTKGCVSKSLAMKMQEMSNCFSGERSCFSMCDSDFCNGYGRCPPWAPNCVTGESSVHFLTSDIRQIHLPISVPALSADVFNLTMTTVTTDEAKLKSCRSVINQFLLEQSSAMYAAFEKDSCKYVRLSFDQRLMMSKKDVAMSTVIRRKYMSHEGTACLYSENKKHRPFNALVANFEKEKKKKVCFGAVGFSLKTHVLHRCAYGMHFTSSDGWCVRK